MSVPFATIRTILSPGGPIREIQLILNADDYGYAAGVSRGILEAARAGGVTATSAMPLRSGPGDAIALAETGISVGLHLELDDVPDDPREIRRRMDTQLERFRNWLGREPDQVDSHHHTHLRPTILAAFAEFAADHQLPARAPTPETAAFLRERGVATPDAFLGGPNPFIQWTDSLLQAALRTIGPGITELCCHPGYVSRDLASSYREGREIELRALTDPGIGSLLRQRGIVTTDWRALKQNQ